jgi:hypothetical protein
MAAPMRLLGLVPILLLAAGCSILEPSPVTVPAGATTIPLTVEEGPSAHVTFQPSQIPAGTTFLVLEGPAPGFVIVAGPNSDAAVATPLDSDAVNRVAFGNLEGTTLLPMQVTCATEEWTEADHWAGCGEVFRIDLQPGFYPIVAGNPQPGEPPTMSVLEVVPSGQSGQ